MVLDFQLIRGHLQRALFFFRSFVATVIDVAGYLTCLKGVRGIQQAHWILADQAVVSGANFLTGILLVRLMGLEKYGVFTLAWMAIQFVSSVQMATITTPMLSIGPKHTEEESPAYFGAVLVQQLIFCGVSFTLFIIGASVSRYFCSTCHIDVLTIPLAVTAVAFLAQDFVRRYFFTHGQVVQAFINDCISYVGQLLVLLGLAQATEIDGAQALWVIGITSGIAAVVGYFSFQRMTIDLHVFRAVMTRHWQFSKWLLLKTHLYQLTTYPLVWSLGIFRGSEAVGVLNASKNIVGVLHVIYLSLDNIIQPRASRLMITGGLNATIQYILRVFQIAAIPVSAVCLSTAVFPHEIAGIFYGNVMNGHETVLVLFAATYFLAFLEKPFSYILLTLENTGLMAVSDASKFFFALTLSMPIVKLYGMTGAMALMVFLNTLGISVLLYGCRKTLGNYFRDIRRIA